MKKKMATEALVLLALVLAHLASRAESAPAAPDAPQPQGPLEHRLSLRFSCESEQVRAGDQLACDLALHCLPEGGPALVPRYWPLFEVRDWSGIRVQVGLSSESGAWTPLRLSAEAEQGGFELHRPLSMAGLLYLAPGEFHGWRYVLNRSAWMLPKEPGTYQLTARLDLPLRSQDTHKELRDGIEAFFRDARSPKDLAIPNEVVESNSLTVVLKGAGS